MSSNTDKLRIIEPVFFVPNSRTEIRLQPDTIYRADARLIEIGAQGGATAYNSLLGALSVIKSIGLFDGATPLDTINDFGQWRAIQSLNVKNDSAISVGRYTAHYDLGYIVQGVENLTEGFFGTDQNISIAQPDNATGDVAWISLKSVFPFLAASDIIPTNIYRQMRLVIEFNSAAEMQQLVVDSTVNNLVTTRPLLLIDEMMPSPERDEAMAMYQPPVWATMVQDSFNLPAQGGTADNNANRVIPQEINQKLRGFNGQYVRDLTVKVTPLVTPAAGTDNFPFGRLGSQSLWTPSLQVVVNGSNLMPRQGIQGKMRALAHYTDSLGSIPTFYPQATNGQKFAANAVQAKLQNTQGQLNLFGIDVEDMVEDLQLNIRRLAVFNNPTTSASYTINVFGRCARRVQLMAGAGVSDTKYRIVFA